MQSHISVQQIHFVSLQTAIFCVQCELISANTTPRCLACGSGAVLNLSRVLGGSLRGQPMARVLHDDELNQLVRQLLSTVPGTDALSAPPQHRFTGPQRQHARAEQQYSSEILGAQQIDLEPAIGVIAERAQVLTGATGAAIALRKGSEVICRARVGRTAPDLGVRLQTDSGVSAQCLQTGEVVLCNNADSDPHADRVSCQRLGVRSILAAPLREFHKTLGIFEVLSAAPNAFNHLDVATMQLLSGMMVAALARASRSCSRC